MLRLFGRGGSPEAGSSWGWMGRAMGRGGDTLKLSPSSRVVCRLPSELPVAREESLWDGCCSQREGVVRGREK